MPDQPAASAPESSPANAAGGACANCGTPLLGPYCYRCGQPKKGWIRKISGIVADFLDTVFDLDSRIPRTLGPLYCKPGFLTCEYFEGRRVRYVTPLRLYFFLSVIAFFALGVLTPIASQNGSRGFQIELDEAPVRPSQGAVGQRPADAPDAADPDDPNPQHLKFFDSKPWHPESNPLRIDWLGSHGNRWLNARIGVIAANLQTARKHPDRLIEQMLAKAPLVLFVLLPVFALLLKAMFLFKRRLYMEHLIVALHSHSFLSLSILLIAALSALAAALPQGGAGARLVGLAEVLAWIWIPINLLIAHKRIYRQGWFFTLLKFSLIGICYSVLIGFGMVLNVVLSLATL